jgi:drug/metabolite transporter (DMT)-like permease
MKQEVLGLGISIIAVSFASILIKLCSPLTPPLAIALLRLVFTTLLVSPVLVLRPKIRHELRRLPRKSLLIMIGIGIVLAAHFSLWITSLTMTSVASSVILVTCHPIIVAPLSYLFLREHLSRLNALGIAISLAGVLILVTGNQIPGSLDTLEGNILAWLGGVGAGLYILGGRLMRRTISLFTYVIVVYTIASLVLALLVLILQVPLTGIPLRDIGLILLMAFISGILGHTLYNWALGHIKASVASVALLGEPIGSALLALVILNQIPPVFTLLGGAIILLGIYLTTRPPQTIERGEPLP